MGRGSKVALGNPYCLPIPKIEIRDVLSTRRVKPQLVKFLQKERCMLMQGTKLGRLPTVKPGGPEASSVGQVSSGGSEKPAPAGKREGEGLEETLNPGLEEAKSTQALAG